MKKILLILLVSCTIGFAQQPQLYINEFLASNDSLIADEKGDFDDFIEIYNAGTEAVDIGGMYITDDLSEPAQYQIPTTAPDSTTIPAGGFLRLWADKESEQGVLHVEIKLSGKGEQIGLYNTDQTILDTLTYTTQTADTTMGRLPDGSDNWVYFENGTPGNSNKIVPVVINEFLASNDACCTDENGNFDDFIELYNGGAKAVDIGGMYITDDLADFKTWQIPTTSPDSTTIQPGGFLILWADKESEQGILHVELKLSSGGEQIGLFTSDSMAIDTLTFGDQTTDISRGLNPDGSTQWVSYSTPTPGKSNSKGIINAIGDNQDYIASSFKLNQNYPNPFNPQTTLSYTLASQAKVVLGIFDIQGKLVTTLQNGVQAAGEHAIVFNGADLASGVYLLRLQAGGSIQSKKMVLMK